MADQRNVYGELIARAWSDEAFAARLRSDPHGAMNEVGFKVPPSVQVQVLESTENKQYIVIPPKPSGELSDEALDQLAGGGYETGDTFCCCCW